MVVSKKTSAKSTQPKKTASANTGASKKKCARKKISPDPEEALKGKDFRDAKSKARQYAKNPKMAFQAADDAMKKAESLKIHGKLQKVWDSFMTMIRLVKSWAKGEYTAVPWKSILLAISAIVYFLIPTDFIPDFIVALGYLDDASVIAWIIASIKKDLDQFKEWETHAT